MIAQDITKSLKEVVAEIESDWDMVEILPEDADEYDEAEEWELGMRIASADKGGASNIDNVLCV